MSKFVSIDEFKEMYPYDESDLIDSGTYGSIYRSGNTVVKVSYMDYDLEFSQHTVTAITELNILSSFSHPNLINIRHAAYDGQLLYISMPYGTQVSNLSNPKHICGLLSVIDLLHRNGYSHGDIKPDNIVMIDNIPTLIDFGLSSMCYEYKGTLLFRGIAYSRGYRAPEHIHHDLVWNMASNDIYALGKTIIDTLPLNTENPLLEDLIDKMIAPSESRYSISDLLNHPYLSSIESIDMGTRYMSSLPEKKEYTMVNQDDYYNLVTWLYVICDNLNVHIRTLFLLLHNIHRSSEMLTFMGKHRLQLWGISHLFLSCLLLEGAYIDLSELVAISDHTFDEHDIIFMIWNIINHLEGVLVVPTLWDYAISGESLHTYIRYAMYWRYDTLKSIPIYHGRCGKIYKCSDLGLVPTRGEIEKSIIRMTIKPVILENPLYPITDWKQIESITLSLKNKDREITYDDLGFIYNTRYLLEGDSVLANEILHKLIHDNHDGKYYSVIFGRKLELKGNIRKLEINSYTTSYDELKLLLE